jgi:hypothetical protein
LPLQRLFLRRIAVDSRECVFDLSKRIERCLAISIGRFVTPRSGQIGLRSQPAYRRQNLPSRRVDRTDILRPAWWAPSMPLETKTV